MGFKNNVFISSLGISYSFLLHTHSFLSPRSTSIFLPSQPCPFPLSVSVSLSLSLPASVSLCLCLSVSLSTPTIEFRLCWATEPDLECGQYNGGHSTKENGLFLSQKLPNAYSPSAKGRALGPPPSLHTEIFFDLNFCGSCSCYYNAVISCVQLCFFCVCQKDG